VTVAVAIQQCEPVDQDRVQMMWTLLRSDDNDETPFRGTKNEIPVRHPESLIARRPDFVGSKGEDAIEFANRGSGHKNG
jgi:hypothetical protein